MTQIYSKENPSTLEDQIKLSEENPGKWGRCTKMPDGTWTLDVIDPPIVQIQQRKETNVN